MKHVGIVEAASQLAALIDEVARGGEIVIVRDGRPVARLSAATSQPQPAHLDPPSAELIERRRQAIERIRQTARDLKINPTHDEIKAWINEGRH